MSHIKENRLLVPQDFLLPVCSRNSKTGSRNTRHELGPYDDAASNISLPAPPPHTPFKPENVSTQNIQILTKKEFTKTNSKSPFQFQKFKKSLKEESVLLTPDSFAPSSDTSSLEDDLSSNVSDTLVASPSGDCLSTNYFKNSQCNRSTSQYKDSYHTAAQYKTTSPYGTSSTTSFSTKLHQVPEPPPGPPFPPDAPLPPGPPLPPTPPLAFKKRRRPYQSVRRKLEFKTAEESVDLKLPKFRCELNLPEEVYNSLSLEEPSGDLQGATNICDKDSLPPTADYESISTGVNSRFSTIHNNNGHFSTRNRDNFYTGNHKSFSSGANESSSTRANETYPTGANENFSSEANESYPTGAERYPTGAESYPAGAESYPAGAESYPTGAESYPAGAESYPTGAESYPSGANESYPTGAENYPSGAENYPSGAENYPSGANESYPYGSVTNFPAIGVFWDIENCRIPKNLSALHVVKAIRNRFFDGYREAEFVCVCDTLKENPKVLEELNDTQVNIVHVGSIKNAADDKLLQTIRRFADLHGAGSAIVLISGDSDFATELYDLRYRKRLRIVLVHNPHAQDCLKLSAHETILFTDLTQDIPEKTVKPKMAPLSKDITVWNLPDFVDNLSIKRRLQFLASNCGGKGIQVKRDRAKISFQTPELAARAKKRIEGEDVFGYKVICSFGKDKDLDFQSSQIKYRQSCNSDLYTNLYRPIEDRHFHRPQQLRQSESPSVYIESPSNSKQSSEENVNRNMDFNNMNIWNKPYPTSSINGTFSTPLWGAGQAVPHMMNNGRASMNSTPVYPPSNSMGSSRESSPHSLGVTKETYNRSFHRISSPLDQNSFGLKDCSSYDTGRVPRISQPWLGNYSKGTSHSLPDFPDQSALMSLGNLSLADTSQESASSSPVELLITNLDQNIDAREMKKVLMAWFRERVMVLHVSVFVQSDASLAATVTVPTQQDAQYAISQLHRKRIGTKRIIISYANHSHQPPEIKRAKVLSLLKEVPGRKLPLFKFRELFERRYQETIGVSEMYNMRDIITVSDNTTGRMVCLHADYRNMSSSSSSDASIMDPNEQRYCKVHSRGPDRSIGWAERDHSTILPNVKLPLKVVGSSINLLLQSHGGSFPLASLTDCWKAEVGPLEECVDGVPLEHLVSCLTSVTIVTGSGGFKIVHRGEHRVPDDADELSTYVSPPLVGHLALFSRELVDLLKTFPHCRMPFSRFIPAYHHHFGRQCRVADYGYTKLSDLLVSLPHLIQILGEGTKKAITLAHKAQVKRFSSDLLRVLKSQHAKVISLEEFPDAYEKIMNKVWNVTDYGVCDIMDLLREVQETTVILKKTDGQTTIAIPKREQTAEEIERTRLFAMEVVELLRHSPECKMSFSRFIPAYHHHFSRQCRVSDYGFSKLIELFEAIPDVLKIVGQPDEEGDKMLQLAEKEALKILGDQIFMLVKNSPKKKIGLSALSTVFTHYYGHSVKPINYGCHSLDELIMKLRNHVQLEHGPDDISVTLVDRSSIIDLWLNTRRLLWDFNGCSMPIKEFETKYQAKYKESPKMEVFKKDLEEFVQVDESGGGEIKLVPVQIFARDILILLNEAGGRMLLANFENAYLNRFGVACRPATLGFPNLVAVIQSLGDLASIKGRGIKRIIVLNRELDVDLPSYCPPPPRNLRNFRENEPWTSSPSNPIPPPPSYSHQNVPPPSSPCDHNIYRSDVSSPHMVLGLTPPPQPTYHQPASPVMYPGSPAAQTGSVVWGQMWSPRYSVLPPLSPATHYMMPTIPFNWGNLQSQSVLSATKSDDRNNVVPISIQTLDQLGKDSPPNPSELPTPELFTTSSSSGEVTKASNLSAFGATSAPQLSTSGATSKSKIFSPSFDQF